MSAAIGSFIRHRVCAPLIDFIYPPVCLACAGIAGEGGLVCPRCLSDFEPIVKDSTVHTELREHCRSKLPSLADAYSSFEFNNEGALQKLLHALKYSGMHAVGKLLGRRLGESLLNEFAVDHTWTLAPVPLHPAKERERGYNQSLYICRGISDITGAVVRTDILGRNRKTGSQTRLSLDERSRNVRGAFEFRLHKTDRLSKLAIVDDVITTGSTIGEVGSSVPRNYYDYLYFFSIAYAPLSPR